MEKEKLSDWKSFKKSSGLQFYICNYFSFQVFRLTGEHPPDPGNLLSTKYDEKTKSLMTYINDVSFHLHINIS